MAEFSSITVYLIVIFLVIALFSSVWALLTLRAMKKKLAKAERKISLLQEKEEETSEGVNLRIAALKKSSDETANQLLTKFSEIIEKVSTSLKETKKSVVGEVSQLIESTHGSMKASVKASLTKTQDAVNRGIEDSRKELEAFSLKLDSLSEDVQRMKIDLQERTIDLEL